MNQTNVNPKENVLTTELTVTIFLEKAPEVYFFGAISTDEAGHLNVYTNGRLQVNDRVLIKPHDSTVKEGWEEFDARIMSISPTSSPHYTYAYEYGIRVPE